MAAKTGVWLIGACGGVSATTILGTLAIRGGMRDKTGLLTESATLSELPLPNLEELVFGGHELSDRNLVDACSEVQRESRCLSDSEFARLVPELTEIERRVQPGVFHNGGPTIQTIMGAKAQTGQPSELVNRLREDLEGFQSDHGLDQVVVLNVASTEPGLASETTKRWTDLEPNLDRDSTLRSSSLYAIAAAQTGFPFINFTPSPATLTPAIQDLFTISRVPFAGSDGKTGETLVKSVLAPLFKHRNLEVLSWQGYNLLGDRDGQVLSDPENKISKLESKDRLLHEYLNYSPHTKVSIDFVPSLGDFKTAWDFIHFAGFLGVKMSMQFTWQGCDSILAAPLILDLVRLASLAQQAGQSGALEFLALYFKSPFGNVPHDFPGQVSLFYESLEALRPTKGH